MTDRPRVLVIEDEEFSRDLLTQLLSQDYEVTTAVDGAAGVESADRDRPDLILMDMTLPVMDGLEATRRIKQGRGLAHIPIIAVTGRDSPGEEARARECGCADYILKPIDEDLLLERIAYHLGRTSTS